MNYKNAKHGKTDESSSAPAAPSRPIPAPPPAPYEASQAALAEWQRPRDASHDSPRPKRRAGDRRKGLLAGTPVPAVVPPV